MKKTIIDYFDRKNQQLICLMSSIMDLIDGTFNNGLSFFKISIIDLFDDKIKGMFCLIKDQWLIVLFFQKVSNICCD